MNTGIGAGIMEIATGLMGIALIALIIGNAGKTTTVISGAGGTFNELLRTVTLQGQTTGAGNFRNPYTGS